MILLVDKPQGRTSFDVVRYLKKDFKGQKIGHSGTLDPMATGLLVLGIGDDTKKLSFIQQFSKKYEFKIDFSRLTDTRDADFWEKDIHYPVGIEQGKKKIDKDGQAFFAPTIETILSLFHSLIPEKELPLPDFSAKKISGKKMYELARKGQNLERKSVMKIFSFNLKDYEFPYLSGEIEVGSGTYIRSIAYWLGSQLGLGGILIELRRISVGDYLVTDAKKIVKS